MSKLGSWFRVANPASHASTTPLTAVDEAVLLADALSAAQLIMDDDIEGADELLQTNDSSFHKMGRGVTSFMRSLLGFEPEVMKQAAERLLEAENAAWADMKRAQRDPTSFQSTIYAPGSEYALCYSQAQLMSAVVGVLNESLAEAIKGFYKLRKAYITLDAIMKVEQSYVRRKAGLIASSKTSIISQNPKHMPGGFDSNEFADAEKNMQREEEDNDLVFIDADESHSGMQTPANYLGHVDTKEVVEEKLKHLSISAGETGPGVAGAGEAVPETKKPKILEQGPDSEIFTDPIDIYIHSGTNLCYGLLLLILSMVPPAFGRLLSIVGFKGDRERGLSLLWQSTKISNINGAVAGLVLLGYYNGLLGFCDILSDTNADPSDLTGYPKARCAELLTEMRTRYPESRLWRLEAARMASGNRQLKTAIELLNANTDSKMKQITALNMFERALDSMYLHDYRTCAKSFESCVELNNWSHALYFYVAGAAYVELYRDLKDSDATESKRYKDKAAEYIKKAPSLAGKKKFMAKQLPFDSFVIRKVQKWEERAKEWGVDLVDAIGVSPVEEMIYLWNGPKRMGPEDLETSLAKLEWSRSTHPEKHEADLDEIAIRAVLQSSIFRNQDRFEDARDVLKKEILSHDRFVKPHSEDDPC